MDTSWSHGSFNVVEEKVSESDSEILNLLRVSESESESIISVLPGFRMSVRTSVPARQEKRIW